jgi:hypothetical protein
MALATGHSCARILSSGSSHGYDLIVVGGTNGSSMASVEIFDMSKCQSHKPLLFVTKISGNYARVTCSQPM